jgi:hypothetical protein
MEKKKAKKDECFGPRPSRPTPPPRTYIKLMEYASGNTNKPYTKMKSLTVYAPLDDVLPIVRQALNKKFGQSSQEPSATAPESKR